MKINRSLFISGIFSLLAFLVLPLGAKAADEFSPTVKIVAYHQLLNGQLMPIGQGSGTIISPQGEILTNAHVVMNDSLKRPNDTFSICVSITPQNPPECRFTAHLERYDEKIDLALLQIDKEVAFGTFPAAFPYLSYAYANPPQENSAVTVRGFPTSGGVTISTTQGQISGFEQNNGYEYIKTDADIDAGNSGGTMLDEQGNFIGIPTYVVSYYQTAGRALEISAAKNWIDGGQGILGALNNAATTQLKTQMQFAFNADETKKITYSQAPGFSATMPEGWHFLNSGQGNFGLSKKDNASSYVFVNVSSMGFKSDWTLQQQVAMLKVILGEDQLPPSETIKLNGNDALRLSKKTSDGTLNIILLEYGYHAVLIQYNIPDNDITQTQADVDAFLNSIQFSFPDADDPAPTSVLTDANFPFNLKLPTDWRFAKATTVTQNLAEAGRKNGYLEMFRIYYDELPKGNTPNNPVKGLEYDINHYLPKDAEVVYKTSELKVDGLPGWYFTYNYTENGAKMRGVSATILDPEYELYFDYQAQETIFDDGFNDFIYALKSFHSTRYNETLKPEWNGFINVANKGAYNVPLPPAPKPTNTVNLTDITGHRYEQSIRNLVAMGVINGNPDGTFRPEDPVNRAASLKIILQSLRAKQLENGEAPFVMPADFNKFSDVNKGVWYETYVAEGVNKGIINGYPDGTFKGDQNVILAEALKMTLEAHKASVWNGTTDPWYKKYFDAAFQLKLLPSDLQDPAHVLTRAELAYIVDQLVSQ